MCNQRDVFTLSSWLQLFNKSQKSYDENVGYGTYQLLYWYQSAGEAVPHQMDLAEQARSSMTSWLQLSNAGQGLGITGRTGGHTVSVCGKIPAKFPIHLFTAAVQNRSEGFSAGLGERRGQNGANNLVEPAVFMSRDFNSGSFSQVRWKTGVCVINLLRDTETVTCWHTYTDILTSLCGGEKKCSSVSVYVECVGVAL